ncbi:threonyl-trna synthetase [Lasallia pustulata]|uniref:threonine--tRNA ligase n=1 Tax=Lasallia pustulata TaxID=136370 RepID=A0A1W5D4I5_9LECA|nr:threonyl-trna synthetase [Lasallia pustulata]
MFDVRGRGAEGTRESKEIGEDEEFGLKPMNCPGHCLLFKSQKRSYKDLPIRYADFSPLHRNEASGALSGLTRVRRFHQDDGHIFCRPSQVREEIESTLEFVGLVYGTFGLGPYKLVLSTRPKENYMGKAEEWDRAETQLKEALNRSGREWELNEGDGAFYGPKIDIILRDSDGKEHQTATIQLDFQLPQRFALEYQSPAPGFEARGMSVTDSAVLEQSGMVTPVIIHRAILGSLERFMALLIEHYKGRWPFWLSPRQAILLTVDDSEEVLSAAHSIVERLSAPFGLQRPRPLQAPTFVVDTDYSPRSMGKKVSEAKRMKYNLVMVLGKRNMAEGTVDVDITGQPKLEVMMSLLQEMGFSDSTGQLKSTDSATGTAFKKPRAVKLPIAEVERLMINLSSSYL